MRPIGALLLLVVASMNVACTEYEPRTEGPFRPAIEAATEDESDGETLYKRDCGWCHGATGEGTERAPNLIEGTNGPALSHFVLTTGRMPLNFPEQRVQRTPTNYSTEQIDAIVAFVDGFDPEGPEVPEVDDESADLPLGQELYQENCAACHSATGIGGALATGDTTRDEETRPQTARANIAPELDASSPQEVVEAMITGPGTMPVFGHDTFTDEELNSVARYVTYLQRPENRGGADVGGVGPVAEGAVGWIVGLGLLLIFARLIGTRAGQP